MVLLTSPPPPPGGAAAAPRLGQGSPRGSGGARNRVGDDDGEEEESGMDREAAVAALAVAFSLDSGHHTCLAVGRWQHTLCHY